MESSASIILTPYNYFDWKPKILLQLRSKGLYRIVKNKEVKTNAAVEKSKYFNRMDEAFGLLCLSISQELLFHVEACTTPNEVWNTLETLFGKQDEMWGHILENELISLDPRNFDNIQDYFTKFKALLLQLKECGINKSKEENKLILAILSKLGPQYVVFVSAFHTIRLTTGKSWKMATLDAFIESLVHEQDKLIKMGTLKSSKAHALVVHTSDKRNFKSNQQSKTKKLYKPCSFCGKEGHSVNRCWMRLEALEKAMQQHEISATESSSSQTSQGHALTAWASSSFPL